jgi:hypothetical protein
MRASEHCDVVTAAFEPRYDITAAEFVTTNVERRVQV